MLSVGGFVFCTGLVVCQSFELFGFGPLAEQLLQGAPIDVEIGSYHPQTLTGGPARPDGSDVDLDQSESNGSAPAAKLNASVDQPLPCGLR